MKSLASLYIMLLKHSRETLREPLFYNLGFSSLTLNLSAAQSSTKHVYLVSGVCIWYDE